MPRLIQLRRCGESSRTRADDSDCLAGSHLRPPGTDHAFLECAVDDRNFNVLDCDRIRVNTEDTGTLAWGRAYSSGEFGKIVGRE
jgi:hypothetical protein